MVYICRCWSVNKVRFSNLNLEKLLKPTVYTLASTNINQSAPNLVKMYVTIRSWMSLIMDLIRAELSELFALEFAKIAEFSVNKVKYGKFSNSRADNSDSSGPITSIKELIRDLMVIYILTKFGADWLIFVDARMLTRKLWMDVGRMEGHRSTVSDHNSSLGTPCSCELKKLVTSIFSFPAMFSKGLFFRVVKKQESVVKS